MHPFLPLLSLTFLAMGDAGTFFLWKHGNDFEMADHRSSILALIIISLLFGGALAFWLRKFKLRFPAYFALASILWVIVLTVFIART